MRLARSILLFKSRPKSNSGDADLFSMNIKNVNEIIPAIRKVAIDIVELLPVELLLAPVPISK